MSIFIQSEPNFYNSGRPYPLNLKGDIVNVNQSDSRHYKDISMPAPNDNIAGSFGDVFNKALEKVNEEQIHADELTQQMAIDPDSVDVHEVMIAAEKARLSITFTKTIADGVVRAYKELTSLR